MSRNRPPRTLVLGPLEALDERIVPSGAGVTPTGVAASEALVANRGGQALGSIYTQYVNYEAAGAQGAFTSSLSNQIYMNGTSVGVDITFHGGDYNTLLGQLQGIGMQVTATLPQNGLVEGYLPMADLPVVASNGYATTISPVEKPILRTSATNQIAANEALVANRGGQALGSLYTQFMNYDTAGDQGTFTSTLSNRIYTSGTSVGVNIHFTGGDFNTLVSQLEGIGMQVTAISAQNGIVEGYLPIAQLPVVASNGYVTGLSPIYKPILR